MLPYEARVSGYHFFIVCMVMMIGDIFASFMSEMDAHLYSSVVHVFDFLT